MGFALDWMGRKLAGYLSAPGRRSTLVAIDPAEAVADALRPGDVLLVDGNTRIATAIKYLTQSTCRPVGLSPAQIAKMLEHAIARVGHRYDLKNVFDLARYLFPVPPVPSRLRRRLIALGSGDPTRAICSTLIAQAFESVGYPILPEIMLEKLDDPACSDCYREIMHVRHHSLIAPRDFDISPYFAVIKPAHAGAFDFTALAWPKSGDYLRAWAS